MKSYYNLDGVKTELEKELEKTQKLLARWEQVSFPTKKDGSPFATLSKNIQGATYYNPKNTITPGQCSLQICVLTEQSGYITDVIDCYENTNYMDDPKKWEKTQNLQPVVPGFCQMYTYDLEDIKEAVAKQINYLEHREAALKNQLQKAEKVYNSFKSAYSKAREQLEKDSEKEIDSTLYYAVLGTIEERYPYY